MLGGHCTNSGWKLFADESWEALSLEEQLQKWLNLLEARKSGLQVMNSRGYRCALDVFVSEPENFTCAFEPVILQAFGDLGIWILVSFDSA